MLNYSITEGQDQKLLRDFLRQDVGLSRSMVTRLKYDGGQILVNQKEVGVRTRLKAGDRVQLIFPKEERSPALIPAEMDLDIVYEDEFLIILNKQAGTSVVPSVTNQSKTIANGLIHYYDQQGLDYTVHIVTRLDRDTSGLMLIAKQQFMHSFFRNISIERRYQAVVQGKLRPKKGTIDAPIGRKPGSIISRIVTDEGKPSITHYEVIGAVGQNSIVEIELETGRTHQIRVHFAHLGCPLLGDSLYGGPVDRIERQALHCVELSFTHPMTKEKLTFQSEWPADLKRLE